MAKTILDRVSNKAIGQLLIERGFISAEQCDEALAKARHSGSRLGETLLSMGYVSRDVLNYALGEQFGLQPVELHPSMVDESLVRRFPLDFLHRHLMLPLIEIGNEIVVVVSDPNNTMGLREFASFVPAYQVSAQIADAEQVRRCLEAIDPESRHRSGYDPTPLPMEGDLEAMAAKPSEENFVRWLLTAAVQHPDSDLLIACSEESAVVTRRRSESDENAEAIHEFDADLFPTVRDALVMQCDPISPARGQIGMLKSPLRFAGGLYALQVALLRHIGGEVIRLRPLAYSGTEDAAPLAAGLGNGSEESPPELQVVLYESIKTLEEYLGEFFLHERRGRGVPLLLQNTTRKIFSEVVSYPGLYSDAPALAMAVRATAVVFDYPVDADMVLRIRATERPSPRVVICAPSAGGVDPDILQLIKVLSPAVALLGGDNAAAAVAPEDVLERFGGKA